MPVFDSDTHRTRNCFYRKKTCTRCLRLAQKERIQAEPALTESSVSDDQPQPDQPQPDQPLPGRSGQTEEQPSDLEKQLAMDGLGTSEQADPEADEPSRWQL